MRVYSDPSGSNGGAAPHETGDLSVLGHRRFVTGSHNGEKRFTPGELKNHLVSSGPQPAGTTTGGCSGNRSVPVARSGMGSQGIGSGRLLNMVRFVVFVVFVIIVCRASEVPCISDGSAGYSDKCIHAATR